MATPLNDIIKPALKHIGALSAGENPSNDDAQDALQLLNDMLNSWSNESMMLYAKQEVIQELVGGQYIYTIGNGGSVGATFQGSIAGTKLTVTGLTSGAISVGQVISTGAAVSNTIISSLGTAFAGNGTNAVGTYYLDQTQNVTATTFTSYAPRPLKINSAIVRVVNSITGTLDYPVAVLNYDQYQMIGIKTLPGPWPRAVYYQPTEPLGVLNYWPNPSQGEMHLYCDMLMGNFNGLQDRIILPQGYRMALQWNLAEYLIPQYGRNDQQIIAMVMKNAASGRAMIKRTNMAPQQPARFDNTLIGNSRTANAGFVLDGGFGTY